VGEINALPQYGQLVWLGEGKNRFASLYAETESSTNLGVVILLHDIGSHPVYFFLSLRFIDNDIFYLT
jgi:hypothetical protein